MNVLPGLRPACLAALLSALSAGASPGVDSRSRAAPGPLEIRSSQSLAPTLPVLAILDPVDLSKEAVLPQPGQVMRSMAGRAGRFQVISGLETARKLMEFDWNGGRPCHDFQCAFDAGNILMADYILYGMLTPLDSIHVFAFTILDIRSGAIVHSAVGHTARNPPHAGVALLHGRLSEFASGLHPSAFRKPGKAHRGVIAVVDRSETSTESRVLVERIGTRIHSIGTHDLMGEGELRELLSAMEIPLRSSAATDSGLLDMGARLKAAYLVGTDLGRVDGDLRLDLSLFDIAAMRRVGSWTSNPSRDFREILRTEDGIFGTLEELTGSGWSHPLEAESVRGGFPWVRSLLTVAGIAAAGGIGALAYGLHEDADQAFRKAEASMSPEAGRTWRRKTEEKDRGALLLGSMAAAALAATVTVWAF